MDETCENCKWIGIMVGVPVCKHHTRGCLNYDYFEPRETIEVNRIEYEQMKQAKEGNFAIDAMESYGEFYDKVVIALGYSSSSLPSSEMDDMMLERISDMTMPEEVRETLIGALKYTKHYLLSSNDNVDINQALDWLNKL